VQVAHPSKQAKHFLFTVSKKVLEGHEDTQLLIYKNFPSAHSRQSVLVAPIQV